MRYLGIFHRTQIRENIRSDWVIISKYYKKIPLELRIYFRKDLCSSFYCSGHAKFYGKRYTTISVPDYLWFNSSQGRYFARLTLVHEAIHHYEDKHHDSESRKQGYYHYLKRDTYSRARMIEIFGK